MRLGKVTAAILLLALAATWFGAAPAAAQTSGDPIVTATRQNAFTIPFRIEPPQTPAQQPVEVQLHVSTDEGANWSLAGRVRPEKGAFVFRAPHDGQYWYSIRTVDAQGIARPEGPLAPQLKVTVDTVAPRLDLSVARGAAGEIVARWQAVDPNLKQGSFKLEYQSDSQGPWEKVAVESPPGAMRHTLSGEATWWPNAASGPILVRAEISDQAGNPAVTQAVVKPGDFVPPAVSGRGGLPPAGAEGWRGGDAAAGAGAAQSAWPPDRAVDNGPGSVADRGDPSSAPAGFVPDPHPPSGNPPNPSAAQPVSSDARTSAQVVSSSRTTRPGSPLDFSLLPPAVRPRMVAARQFELEYEIDSVGPSGVGRVELWGTRDGGRTWSDYAVDADNRSPMPVTVAGEGIYGFRILVHSGAGFGGQPPAAGDSPDIWVGIDTTKPTCRIVGSEVSPDASELSIRWEAADDAFDPRPITLLFAASPNGPWTPIASGLENTGSFRWRLDPRVPERILLRIEARDEAGNVGTFDTTEWVSLDRHRPSGRIRGVRPLGN